MKLNIYFDLAFDQFLAEDDDANGATGETPELAVAAYKRLQRAMRKEEYALVPPVVATRRCPHCYTHGYVHRSDCQNVNAGMTKHVAI